MKIFKIFFTIAAIVAIFFSCQKELKFPDTGVASGTFKKDAGGDCLPVTVTGVFKVDSVLTNALFVDVQINASTPGNFDIRTDTVNGISFYKVGSVPFGVNTIRLYPSGKPIAAGTNTFTVHFGFSTCTFDITTVGTGTPAAAFTLSGSPTACTGATIGGAYMAGVTLDPSNTLTVEVNVTSLGTYTIIADATPSNNFSFTGSGVFTTLGVQNVTLTGTGKPTNAGVSLFTVINNANNCTYPVTVVPNTPAVYTFDGGTGACNAYVVSGTYIANTPVTASNTVTLNVTVTTPGTYTITTNAASGLSFSKTGVFTTTGANTVVLNATGTPIAPGTITFAPTGTGNCSFAINIQTPPPPAVYTLGGAGGACTPITVNGTYLLNTALTTSNTAVVQVNVTTAGVYTLSTNTVNGMTFSKSGTFATTGLQSVTLQGSGTPVTATTSTLTPQAGASSCTFNVVVAAAPPPLIDYYFQFNDGTKLIAADPTSVIAMEIPNSGIVLLSVQAFSLTGDSALSISVSTTGNPQTGVNYKTVNLGIPFGTFGVTSSSNGQVYQADFSTTQNINFKFDVIDIPNKVVSGTFSGTAKNLSGGTATITNGKFKAALQ